MFIKQTSTIYFQQRVGLLLGESGEGAVAPKHHGIFIWGNAMYGYEHISQLQHHCYSK